MADHSRYTLESVNAGTGNENYYRHWAPTYDEVYTRPERQGDLLAVRTRLTDWFAGKHVLEVAAGTGWWTSVLGDTAASVTATDVNEATLDVARARRDWPATVDAFLEALMLRLLPGSLVVFVDNRLVAGSVRACEAADELRQRQRHQHPARRPFRIRHGGPQDGSCPLFDVGMRGVILTAAPTRTTSTVAPAGC